MSNGFEFEYPPAGGGRGGPRPARSRRYRRGRMLWVLWLCLALLGGAVSVVMAATAGEVLALGDASFWRAAVGITAVLAASLPGFALFRLVQLREHPNWHERWWRPTVLAGISLLSSVGGALWCGYLIAERIARVWSI